MEKYDILFRPLRVGGITLKNRIIASPTSMSPLGRGYTYTDENFEVYRLKAMGGAAVVTVGEIMVDLESGRSHIHQVGINEPEQERSFRLMTEAIHAGGAFASAELDHGGALCDPIFLDGRKPIGPSGYVDSYGDEVLEMTEEQILNMAELYGQAAKNAKSYGFDMVMIHMGHGWLLHQFISEITNHRTDKWGGSFENRMRFPLLVVEKVRKAVGRSFPIDVRISGSERCPGGYGIETGIEIAKTLDGKVDMLHVSAGTQEYPYSAVLMHPGTFQKPMENAYLAAEIKKHVSIPVCTVGAFSEPDDMVQFMEESGVDAVAMGRALLADPFFPKKTLDGEPEKITRCLRCTECLSGLIRCELLRCAVNPAIGREHETLHPLPVLRKRNILIAGGGPAGMRAALTAAERGHRVTICEKSDRLGGLKFADNADFKYTLRRFRDTQAQLIMNDPRIDVRLNTTVTEELVAELQPDLLLIAVGAVPLRLPIPGADGDNVVYCAEIQPDTRIGHRVVIIGGGLAGSEEAIALARAGHDVTIVEMQDELAPDCGRMHRLNVLHEIENSGNIHAATGHACASISPEGVYARTPDGGEVLFPADTVIMAAGMTPNSEEVDRLRPLVKEYAIIGDALRSGQIGSATSSAYYAVTAADSRV